MLRRALVVLGVILAALGVVLSFVPRYLPTPAGEPLAAGTYWTYGLPMIVVGLAVAALARRVPAPAAET